MREAPKSWLLSQRTPGLTSYRICDVSNLRQILSRFRCAFGLVHEGGPDITRNDVVYALRLDLPAGPHIPSPGVGGLWRNTPAHASHLWGCFNFRCRRDLGDCAERWIRRCGGLDPVLRDEASVLVSPRAADMQVGL